MKNAVDERMGQSEGQKRYYLVREDFEHLMGLLPAAEHQFPGDRKSSTSLVYPKNTEGAFRELRLRGLQCDGIQLWELAKQGIAKPVGARPMMTWTGEDFLEWSKEDIDAAAEWLYENQHWNPWTHFCWVTNVRYGQAVKAYRVAAARYNLPFTIGFDPLGLVTVVEPAENPDDYAYVRFFPKGMKVGPQEASK